MRPIRVAEIAQWSAKVRALPFSYYNNTMWRFIDQLDDTMSLTTTLSMRSRTHSFLLNWNPTPIRQSSFASDQLKRGFSSKSYGLNSPMSGCSLFTP